MQKEDLDQKWNAGRPPRPGVYERGLPQPIAGLGPHYSRWTGREWMRLARTPALAERQTERSLYNAEPFKWRAAA